MNKVIRNILCTSVLLLTGSVNAAILSFTGNFNDDDDRFYISFDVESTSEVILETFGYAGGTNGEGTIIADGGFDPQLFLFNSDLELVDSNDDGTNRESASSGDAYDSRIVRTLTAGSYIAVLNQFSSQYDSGDIYTGNWTSSGVQNFNDRTNEYAVDISGDAISDVAPREVSVPEPSTLAIFALGIVGLASRKSKKQA